MTRQLMAWLGLLASGVEILGLSTYVAAAAGESNSTHTLNTVLELALAHNPTMAGAQGYMRQSRGEQVAAGASTHRFLDTPGVGAFAIRAPGCRLLSERS
jgi:hypothetical protein